MLNTLIGLGLTAIEQRLTATASAPRSKPRETLSAYPVLHAALRTAERHGALERERRRLMGSILRH